MSPGSFRENQELPTVDEQALSQGCALPSPFAVSMSDMAINEMVRRLDQS